ncbi:hypothetical protein QQ045_012709 [Rhodiola kirilowii]
MKKDLMWIRWMNIYFFKDQTIWQCDVKIHHSWARKKILCLREDALKCIEVLDNQALTWHSSRNMFSTKGVYDLIRSRDNHMDWHEMIWNDLAHPKHCFWAWLAVRD